MNLALAFYLASIADHLDALMLIVTLLMFVASAAATGLFIAFTIAANDSNDRDWIKVKNFTAGILRYTVPLLVLSLSISVFMPAKSDWVCILAAETYGTLVPYDQCEIIRATKPVEAKK